MVEENKLDGNITLETDKDLEEILEKNPFSDDVVNTWREECEKIRENRASGCSGVEFVLDSDKEWISQYNRSRTGRDDKYRIRTNLLPQPFIGSPNAPVWILMMNPGYSLRDEYDLASVSPKNKDLLRNECPRVEVEFIPEEYEWTALGNRQKQVLDQLRLPLDIDTFYILHNNFNIMRSAKGGGFKYWASHLFGEGYFMRSVQGDMHTVALENVFILEMLPYHSKEFDASLLKKREINWHATSYGKFWSELVMYGLEKKKVMLVRSPRKVIEQLGYHYDINVLYQKVCGRFFILSNPQGGRFSGPELNAFLPLDKLMSSNFSMESVMENLKVNKAKLSKIFPAVKWG